MSKLIQLRQRSKAIETIKKITHAMRLISMSTHSHLQHLQDPLTKYSRKMDALFCQLMSYAPEWHNPIVHPNPAQQQKTAIILIGSQKGLCGSFNTQLFRVFEQRLEKMGIDLSTVTLIAVGQKAVDFLKGIPQISLQHSYEKFTPQRLAPIAQEITHTLKHTQPHYTSVLIFSNIFKSFFHQKPQVSRLLPIEPPQDIDTVSTEKEDFIWEQTPQEILDSILPQYLESKLQHFLFQSLIAEHAARFISMDSATRNAKELLEANNLEYNKLRQAKITKELSELVGSYQ